MFFKKHKNITEVGFILGLQASPIIKEDNFQSNL